MDPVAVPGWTMSPLGLLMTMIQLSSYKRSKLSGEGNNDGALVSGRSFAVMVSSEVTEVDALDTTLELTWISPVLIAVLATSLETEKRSATALSKRDDSLGFFVVILLKKDIENKKADTNIDANICDIEDWENVDVDKIDDVSK